MSEKASLNLGSLADPTAFQEALDLRNRGTDALLADYRAMVLIRRCEEQIADMAEAKEIRCPVHLAIGQEAVAVGVGNCLNAQDRLYGGHRSHSQYLALGGTVEGLMAEVLGKETGCSGGMGGSMHLTAEDVGFGGCVPIVSGTVPIAVGAAMAFKIRKTGNVGVAFFGDGACEEGVVHECLNIASSMQLPMIFVVENNFFASHLDIHLRQPGNRVARLAEAHGVATRVVDGNDVCAVEQAASDLIDAARKGEGPGFIEAVTYRWRGHVGPDPNIDVGLRRSEKEVNEWKKRDPLGRLKQAMMDNRGVEETAFADIDAAVDDEIAQAVDKARAAAWPDHAVLMDYVYAPRDGQTQAPARA